MCGEHTRNTWRTVCDYVANIPQNANKQSVKYATNTPLGVGAIHRARILTLSNTYIHVIKYVYSHY